MSFILEISQSIYSIKKSIDACIRRHDTQISDCRIFIGLHSDQKLKLNIRKFWEFFKSFVMRSKNVRNPNRRNTL